MRNPRGFPVMGCDRYLPRDGGPLAGPRFIPWEVIDAHKGQAMRNHSQTVDRLAQRGGLGPSELTAVLEDRRFDWGEKGPRTRTGEQALEQAHLCRVVELVRDFTPSPILGGNSNE